jgi:hypothetical protein
MQKLCNRLVFYSNRAVFCFLVLLVSVLLPIYSSGADQYSTSLQLKSRISNLPQDRPAPGRIVALSASATGEIVFVEANDNRLILLDQTGEYLDEAGGYGFDQGTFRKASDIVNVRFEYWVADPSGSRIIRFDNRLAPIAEISTFREQGREIQLDRPLSSAQLQNGDILILEETTAELYVIDTNGQLVERLARFGEIGGELIHPIKIRLSDDDVTAIIDNSRNAVILLDSFGSYIGLREWKLDGQLTGYSFGRDCHWICGTSGIAQLELNGQTIQSWDSDYFGGQITDIAVKVDEMIVAVNNTIKIYSIIREISAE